MESARYRLSVDYLASETILGNARLKALWSRLGEAGRRDLLGRVRVAVVEQQAVDRAAHLSATSPGLVASELQRRDAERRSAASRASDPAENTGGGSVAAERGVGRRLDLTAARRVRAESRQREEEAALDPPPYKPKDAVEAASGRWMWIEPAVYEWFAPHRKLLGDLVADGPFTSLTVRRGSLPAGVAGLTSPRRCADGNCHVWVTVGRGLDAVGMRNIVAHEIGHLTDLCLYGDGWESIADRDEHSREHVAASFETRLRPYMDGKQALTLAHDVLVAVARRVTPRW